MEHELPEIEPCFFCGNDKKFMVFNFAFHCVQCKICEARGPSKGYTELAIETWNKMSRLVREAKENKK